MEYMRIGRNIRDLDIPFDYEVDFSIRNGFDLIQLWYRRGVIDAVYVEDIIKSINQSGIQTIIHGTFDINDFDEYEEDFINTIIKLNHKETIIHPSIVTEEVNEKTDRILADKVLNLCNRLNDLGVKVYIENNHEYMQTFYTKKQWEYFWSKAPSNTEFLMDVVHVLFCDDYEYMQELVNIKRPTVLHIADTKKGRVGRKHLHLPIGDGIIDFNKIFNEILPDFDGLIILEIKNLDSNIINSKTKIEKYLNIK